MNTYFMAIVYFTISEKEIIDLPRLSSLRGISPSMWTALAPLILRSLTPLHCKFYEKIGHK